MKEYDLQKLINSPELVEEKIKEVMEKKLLFKQEVDKEEIEGHILKAENNWMLLYLLSCRSSSYSN